VNTVMNLPVHKMLKISWMPEETVAFRERHRCVELVIQSLSQSVN
jgi:hypothetical protein